MVFDRYNEQMRAVVSGDDRFVVKAATATLKLYEQQVRVNTVAAVTITLPSVAEAKGLLFSILLETDPSGYDLTIADADDSYSWSDITHADAQDGSLLYSDGFVWWVIGTSSN